MSYNLNKHIVVCYLNVYKNWLKNVFKIKINIFINIDNYMTTYLIISIKMSIILYPDFFFLFKLCITIIIISFDN